MNNLKNKTLGQMAMDSPPNLQATYRKLKLTFVKTNCANGPPSRNLKKINHLPHMSYHHPSCQPEVEKIVVIKEHVWDIFTGHAQNQGMKPSVKVHWLELSHMAILETDEAGK